MNDEQLKITEPIVAINVNKTYRVGISNNELYDATRGIWRISKERVEKAEFAFAVYQGVIKEVFEIDQWHPAGSTEYKTREITWDNMPENYKKRFEFVGKIADNEVRDKYISKLLPVRSYGNPILYFNC